MSRDGNFLHSSVNLAAVNYLLKVIHNCSENFKYIKYNINIGKYMKKFEYKMSVIEDVSAVTLYSLGVPMSTIACLFNVCTATVWKTLKRYEKLGIVKVRPRSETLMLTLSKRHTEPDGDPEHRTKEWMREFGIEGIKDILAVILVTDGSASYKHKMISLACSDKVLLGIFTDILKELKLNPRQTLDKRNNLPIVFARSNNVRDILNEITLRIRAIKHQPTRGQQNWKEFLASENQPTTSFLLNRPRKLRELAFRLAMSFEGCVTLWKTPNRVARPRLQFTCFHPFLIEEWKEVANSIKINMIKKKNNLTAVSLTSIMNFLKIGGFIDGVVNSRKSRYFAGENKNDILLSLLEYYYREREGIIPESTSSREINETVKRILEKKEFKSKEYYIHYLSEVLKERSIN